MRKAHLLTISWYPMYLRRGGGLPNPLNADTPSHVTCDACWEANPTICGQKK